ncbi:MAG: hypothetical protein N2747_01010 [Chitinophagaceae bacterium]|nr:hypothetical protein [Chitinophagaceae bacterium]
MATILVLYNLKPDASAEAYEKWAKEKDIPNVNALQSVQQFKVVKMKNLLGSDTPAPYQYAEIIEVNDMDLFFKEIQSETIQQGAKEFNGFADNPSFIVCEEI